MKLEISWRNPFPPAERKWQMTSVAEDETGVMYYRSCDNEEIAFELIHGGALAS